VAQEGPSTAQLQTVQHKTTTTTATANHSTTTTTTTTKTATSSALPPILQLQQLQQHQRLPTSCLYDTIEFTVVTLVYKRSSRPDHVH